MNWTNHVQNQIFIFSQSNDTSKKIKNSIFFFTILLDGGSSELSDSKRANRTICIRATRTVSVRDRAFQNPTHDSFEGNASPHWLRQPLVEWTNKKRVNSFVWSEYETADYCEGSVVENVFVAPARWIIVISLWRYKLAEWSTCFSPSYARWNPSRLSIWNRAINDTCVK